MELGILYENQELFDLTGNQIIQLFNTRYNNFIMFLNNFEA